MGLFDKKPKKKDSFLGGNYDFKYCTTLWKATSITQPTGNLNSRNVNEHPSENTHE